MDFLCIHFHVPVSYSKQEESNGKRYRVKACYRWTCTKAINCSCVTYCSARCISALWTSLSFKCRGHGCTTLVFTEFVLLINGFYIFETAHSLMLKYPPCFGEWICLCCQLESGETENIFLTAFQERASFYQRSSDKGQFILKRQINSPERCRLFDGHIQI